MKIWTISVASLLIPFLTTGCGDFGSVDSDIQGQYLQPHDDGSARGGAKKFRVAIIDDGFDTSLEVFKGKIYKTYTLHCTAGYDSGGTHHSNLSYEDLKRETLSEINSTQEQCELREGIQLKKSHRFAEIAPFRDEWNRLYRDKVYLRSPQRTDSWGESSSQPDYEYTIDSSDRSSDREISWQPENQTASQNGYESASPTEHLPGDSTSSEVNYPPDYGHEYGSGYDSGYGYEYDSGDDPSYPPSLPVYNSIGESTSELETESVVRGPSASLDYDLIQNVLNGEGRYTYHGTSVASLIAYQNDSVELILIQIPLAINDEEMMKGVNCRSQAELDLYTRLFRDPDIVDAVLASPLDSADRQFDQLFDSLDVDFVNTSFGGTPTAKFERLLEKKGCAPARYSQYYKELRDLQNKKNQLSRRNGQIKSKALTIQALGNDYSNINTSADAQECSAVYTLNVGATDYHNRIAEFSNRGTCGDAYAPGQGIIVAAPDGFLNQQNGTSFSSPLFVRYLTKTEQRRDNYDAIYRKFKGSGIRLGADQIPVELFVDSEQRIPKFSLADTTSVPEHLAD